MIDRVTRMHGRFHRPGALRILGAVGAAAAVGATSTVALAKAEPKTPYTIGDVTTVSARCTGQNAEVLQAVDRKLGYVYEAWMGSGCGAIAFARSIDGGRTFGTPIAVPGTQNKANTWDPAITVARDGTVYVAFMIAKSGYYNPVVIASFDHGLTFPQVASLVPPDHKNWGDRPFIGTAPDGTVYVTWDYGPDRSVVTYICDPNGSCAFATGDLNVVIQRSTDRGKTWGPIMHVSPGFPASGGDSAPFSVEENGRIDLSYQGYHIIDTKTYAMKPANTYFTSSDDRGATWSTPILLGPAHLKMSLAEWWIDGALGTDSAGNLYTTWDTQGSQDIGWLSFSTDRGKHWSDLVRVTAPEGKPIHIMEVAGGDAGIAYVSWLTDASGAYKLYLRPYSITKGWLTPPILVSPKSGNALVWPGDTTGISTLSRDEEGSGHTSGDTRVVLSWGSAVAPTRSNSRILAVVVAFRNS